MSKLKLNTDGIEDDFFSGTHLLGIMTPVKNYRFIWQVNANTGFDFRLNTDVEIQLKRKGRNYFFSVYQFWQTECELEHFIYYNQFEGEYLLPEFKHLDFLWLMRGNVITDEDFLSVQNKLKAIEGTQLVTELTQEKIKNKGNLIF
ncbi:MAG TPA: IPExxxVDY family protein [Parafilimonas sp.]|nr:IPExxxVDY family protein [Parafilimonas sp.]